MKPIGPLMWEHRLIEEMATLISRKIDKIGERQEDDTVFIATVVDFFRTYADRTHHGKEEDILFCKLSQKSLSADDKRIMDELLHEHREARKLVGNLLEVNEQYRGGDTSSLPGIKDILKKLTELYPKHIEKEDKHFFFPILKYLSDNEQQAILAEFREFDMNMIHEKYSNIIEGLGGKAIKRI